MKCQKHVNVVHGQFCPVCLVEERDELRKQLAEVQAEVARLVAAAIRAGGDE